MVKPFSQPPHYIANLIPRALDESARRTMNLNRPWATEALLLSAMKITKRVKTGNNLTT